jgi:hypothetical protein
MAFSAKLRACVSTSIRCSPCCGLGSKGAAVTIIGSPTRARSPTCSQLMPWLDVSSVLWLLEAPTLRVSSAFGCVGSLTLTRTGSP